MNIDECPICLENIDGSNNYIATINECMHSFCDICLIKHLKTRFLCPLCRTECKSYIVYRKKEEVEYDVFVYKIENIESIEFEEIYEDMTMTQEVLEENGNNINTYINSIYLGIAVSIMSITFIFEVCLLIYVLLNIIQYIIFIFEY